MLARKPGIGVRLDELLPEDGGVDGLVDAVGLAVGDMNRDGILDLVVAEELRRKRVGRVMLNELGALAAIFGAADAFFAPAFSGLLPTTVSPANRAASAGPTAADTSA